MTKPTRFEGLVQDAVGIEHELRASNGAGLSAKAFLRSAIANASTTPER